MAENVIKPNVLLSSPGNLPEERELVKQVIENINLDSGRREGFVAELVRWETHTRPSVGEYSQAVINEQFPDDIDVFVGMLGAYFGTPTPHWGSGTEEEFRIAFESFQSGGCPEIMFYFHDAASRLSSLNLTEVARVQAFRDMIGQEGVYYWSFQERADLHVLLQRHLNSALLDRKKKPLPLLRRMFRVTRLYQCHLSAITKNS
jgi:hypothetical protein